MGVPGKGNKHCDKVEFAVPDLRLVVARESPRDAVRFDYTMDSASDCSKSYEASNPPSPAQNDLSISGSVLKSEQSSTLRNSRADKMTLQASKREPRRENWKKRPRKRAE